MTTKEEMLASLSEGICPLCKPRSRLDKNRICAAGIEWDIKTGQEIGYGRYEGPDRNLNMYPQCYGAGEEERFYKWVKNRPPIDIKSADYKSEPSQGLMQIIEPVTDFTDIEKRLVGKEVTFNIDTEKLGIYIDYYHHEG